MHRGCFVWTPTPPLAGRRTPRPGPVRVCVCSSFLAGSGGPASRARSGAPHLFPLPLVLSALLGPLRAGVAPFVVLWFPPPPPFFFFFLLSAFRAPLVSFFLWFPAPVALGLGALFLFSPPSRLVFFFFHLAPPLSPAFFDFQPRVPWALALCAVCFVGLMLPGSPRALASFVVPARPVAAPRWLLPPPPFCFSLFFSLPLCAPFFFSVSRPRCIWLSLVSGPGCPGPWRCVLFVLLAYRSPALRALSPLLCFLPCRWLLFGGCSSPPPLPPLPFVALLFFLLPLCAPFFFLRCAPPLSLAFLGFCPRVAWALALCAICFVGLRPLCSPCALAPFVVPALPLAAPWWFLPPPPPPCCVSLFFLLPLCAPVFFSRFAPPCCLWLSSVSGPGCPGPRRCVLFVLLASCSSARCALSPLLWFFPGRWLLLGGCCPPAPFCVSLFFSLPLCAPFFFLSVLRPRCLGLSLVSGPGCPGPWRCGFVLSPSRFSTLIALSPLLCFPPRRWLIRGVCCPPPPLCLAVFVAAARCLFFFSGGFRRLLPPPPPCWVHGALCCLVLPRCAALPFCVLCCGASPCCAVGCCVLRGVCWGVCFCVVLRCWLLLHVVPCLWSCRPVGSFAVWLAAWFWSALPCVVLCCVSLDAVLRRAAARRASRCCVVVCCVVLLRLFGVAVFCAVSSGAACGPGTLCFAVLCFAVFPRAVCSVLFVFCRGVLVRAVVRRCAACCVCPGVSRCAFPVLFGLCGAVFRCARALALCCSCGACCCWRLVLWCAAVCCAVFFGVLWCGAGSGGLWLSAGCVFRCRCPCLAAWSGSLWLVLFAVVPCFSVSCSVVLCCLVVLCCCVLLPFCGAVCACFVLLWPVVLCCAVLLVVCAILCPVVVSVCFGALSLPAGTVFRF